ncbi:hypothetical protein OAP33_04880 [Flavobacteriaceae bacterium]|nr:hypothetical protein [Flavobacteriaceae bacterium]
MVTLHEVYYNEADFFCFDDQPKLLELDKIVSPRLSLDGFPQSTAPAPLLLLEQQSYPYTQGFSIKEINYFYSL